MKAVTKENIVEIKNKPNALFVFREGRKLLGSVSGSIDSNTYEITLLFRNSDQPEQHTNDSQVIVAGADGNFYLRDYELCPVFIVEDELSEEEQNKVSQLLRGISNTDVCANRSGAISFIVLKLMLESYEMSESDKKVLGQIATGQQIPKDLVDLLRVAARAAERKNESIVDLLIKELS